MKFPIKGKAYIDYKLPDEEFSYGKPNRYDESMGCILGNLYGLESELKLERTYN